MLQALKATFNISKANWRQSPTWRQTAELMANSYWPRVRARLDTAGRLQQGVSRVALNLQLPEEGHRKGQAASLVSRKGVSTPPADSRSGVNRLADSAGPSASSCGCRAGRLTGRLLNSGFGAAPRLGSAPSASTAATAAAASACKEVGCCTTADVLPGGATPLEGAGSVDAAPSADALPAWSLPAACWLSFVAGPLPARPAAGDFAGGVWNGDPFASAGASPLRPPPLLRDLRWGLPLPALSRLQRGRTAGMRGLLLLAESGLLSLHQRVWPVGVTS